MDLVDDTKHGHRYEDDDDVDQKTNDKFVVVCKMMVITEIYLRDGIYVKD